MSDGKWSYPTIRVEMDGVRKTIVTHLGHALEQEKGHLEASVLKALEAIDIDALIRDTVMRETPRIIEESIKSAISGAVSQVMYREELRKDLANLVAKSLKLKEF